MFNLIPKMRAKKQPIILPSIRLIV